MPRSATIGFDFPSPRSGRARVRALVMLVVIAALCLGGTAMVNATVILHDGTTTLRARFTGAGDHTSTVPPPTGASSTSTEPATVTTAAPPSTTAPPATTAVPPTSTGGIAGSLKRGVLSGLGPEAGDARGARLVQEAPVGMP